MKERFNISTNGKQLDLFSFFNKKDNVFLPAHPFPFLFSLCCGKLLFEMENTITFLSQQYNAELFKKLKGNFSLLYDSITGQIIEVSFAPILYGPHFVVIIGDPTFPRDRIVDWQEKQKGQQWQKEQQNLVLNELERRILQFIIERESDLQHCLLSIDVSNLSPCLQH